ncbi:MAG: RNA pseudouridine synthase [Treponema sp.]|jgi:RluA family pseudouridine synthase|nr:RNA pseudouridine synthase [Treponema sp.]
MVRRALYEIVYEDERIIAVNKASGVAVGAERWDPAAPRLDKLLRGAAGAEGPEIYTVHRIDKETSGLVVFARDRETHRALSSAFEGRGVVKTYIAVVHGRPAWPGGRASGDLPLKPEGNKRHMTIVDKYQGKPSFTAFRLILSAGNYSLVEALPKTGRTHQIRVHLASLGHPVVCDPLYGKTRGAGEGVYLSSFKRDWRGGAEEERPLLSRLGLHAAALTLPPAFAAAGVPPRLCAPLPRDMAALTRQMEKYGAPRAPE